MEVLCLRGELTAVPSFEFALRERVSHLAQFRHAYYARVRSVERLNDPPATLALVSDLVEGVRLSTLLELADRQALTLDINAALCLIRQIVPAIGMLHDAAPQVSHGAISPERVIVTANARIVVTEYVLGAALEQLRYSQERYWKDLRVATARAGGLPRFDHRSDVTALGVLALSLIAARPLGDDEFPARLPEVLGSAWAISARGGLEPLPAGLRAWLARTMQLDARSSFSTVAEAQAELDRVLGDSDYLAAPAALEAVLAQYRQVAAPPEADAPAAPVALPHAVNDTRPAVGATPASVSVAAAVPTPAATTTPTGAPVAVAPPAAPMMASASSAPSAAPPVAPRVTVLADPVADRASKIDRKPDSPTATPPFRSSSRDEKAAPRTDRSADPSMPPKSSRPLSKDENVAPRTPPREPVVVVSAKAPAIEEPDDIEEEAPAATRNWKMFATAALALAVIGGGAVAARQYVGRSAQAAFGTIVVTTNPAGAQLLVDGVLRGTTPVTLKVAPGAHTLNVKSEGGEPRTIPITVTAGAQLSQYLDLPKSAPSAGQLQVRTEPAGAQVAIDGIGRGPSPVTVSDLTPGDHTVTVESDLGKVEQTVGVTAGAMASVVVPLAAPRGAPVSGWISVAAPADVQLYENGKLLGSSQMDRLMVSAGSHQLELTNEALGYRATRTVQVAPGRVSAVKLDFPKGTIALNAVPWADVWIDGEKVGETPLGNVAVAIGSHEVIFRNPDLGEQRHTVVVSLTAPARLSVDLRKK